MANVTVKDGAAGTAASIAAHQEQSNTITDARGRRIVIRELDALEESRLIFAIGTERAQNTVYVQAYVIPAACAAEIDGESYSVPANLQQLEGRMKILGRDGMNAIAAKLYNIGGADVDAEKEAVKN